MTNTTIAHDEPGLPILPTVMIIGPSGAPANPRKRKSTYRSTTRGMEHQCSSCGGWLPANTANFVNERKSKTGLGGYCRTCNSKKVSAWKADNPTRAIAQSLRRYARDKQVGGVFTAEDQDMLFATYSDKCLACGLHAILVGPLEADHILPVSKGGTHDVSNRQPLCGRCNKQKAAHIVDYRLNQVRAEREAA